MIPLITSSPAVKDDSLASRDSSVVSPVSQGVLDTHTGRKRSVAGKSSGLAQNSSARNDDSSKGLSSDPASDERLSSAASDGLRLRGEAKTKEATTTSAPSDTKKGKKKSWGQSLVKYLVHGSVAAIIAGGMGHWILTPETSSLGLGVAILFVLAAIAGAAGLDQSFIVVGFALWMAGYACMLKNILDVQAGSWPVFHGSYWLAFEFVVAGTEWFEGRDEADEAAAEKGKVKTHVLSVIGHWVFFFQDLCVHLLQVYYGTGSNWCDLGIFPMKTQEQRLFALCFYFTAVLAFFFLVTKLDPRKGRRIKYYGYALHFSAHAAMIRSPLFARGNIVESAARLTTLANAAWAIRFIRKELPTPKWVFRFLMVAMPVWCAVALDNAEFVRGLSYEEYRVGTLAWNALWVGLSLFA